MFERLPAPDHVLAFRLSAKVSGEDIKRYQSLLEGMLAKHDSIGLCVDFTSLSDMNADALIEGTKADLEFISHIGQFSRCAVISDKEWPRAMIGFVVLLFPTLEMKVFTPDQSDEAIKWASEPTEAPRAQSPAFRFLPTSRDDVLAFEINGVISSKEMPGVIKEFEAFLKRHQKVRLLNRMKHFGGIDPAVFMQGGLVSMKLAAMQKVERYAIVGAPAWVGRIIETVNPAFADIDLRTFPADREADAWAWLEAKPSE